MPATEDTRRPVSAEQVSDVSDLVVDESGWSANVETLGTQRRSDVVVVAVEDSNPVNVVASSKVTSNTGQPK